MPSALESENSRALLLSLLASFLLGPTPPGGPRFERNTWQMFPPTRVHYQSECARARSEDEGKYKGRFYGSGGLAEMAEVDTEQESKR